MSICTSFSSLLSIFIIFVIREQNSTTIHLIFFTITLLTIRNKYGYSNFNLFNIIIYYFLL